MLVDSICHSFFSTFFDAFSLINIRRSLEHFVLSLHLLQNTKAHDPMLIVLHVNTKPSFHLPNRFYCKLKRLLFFLDYNYRLSNSTNLLYYPLCFNLCSRILKLFLMLYYSKFKWLCEISLILQYPIFIILSIRRQLSFLYHTNQFRR